MRTPGGVLVALVVLAVFTASSPVGGDVPSPEPSDGMPTFTNVAAAAGLTGGGSFFAWADHDGDGYEDLLVNGNRMYRNEGPPAWRFTDVTATAFPGGSAAGSNGVWGDYDNDGDLDLYVAASPSFTTGASCGQRIITADRWDVLWRNDGDGTFTNVTVAAGGVYDRDPTGAVAWGDYDRDGWIDLFVAGAEDFYSCGGLFYARYFRDYLYRNDGDGTFTDVTTAALGTAEQTSPKYGRGAAWGDVDDDGWPDLYVTNYRQQRNALYRNNRDGTFTDRAAGGGALEYLGDAPPDATNNPDPCGRAGHGVGSSWADYDNDGDLDLVVGTFNHKDWRVSDDTQLWRNNGDGTFANVRAASGIPVKPHDLQSPPHPRCGSSDGSIWTGPQGDELIVGATWGDVDNDGYLDLWMPQIYDINYAYSYLYRGGAAGFSDLAQSAGVRVYDTYGGAFADYDGDGDLDLVTGGRDSGGVGAPSSIHLFRNDGVAGHAWVAIGLEGCGPGVNRAMIGARLSVTAGGATYMRNVEAGQSSHSQQNSLVQHVGLGHYAGSTVDLVVRKPDGTTAAVPGLAVNATHRVRVGCVDPVRDPMATLTGAGLQDVSLSWTLPPGEVNVVDYAIYRSPFYDRSGAGYTLLGTVPRGASTYTHAAAGKGDWSSHFYRIVTRGPGAAAPCATQAAKVAISLAPGPNLVSLPVLPADTRPGALLATIARDYGIVRAYDASDPSDPWKSQSSGGPDYDLRAIRPGVGVWVNVLGSTWISWAVAGRVPDATSVPLVAGWNLVGYASLTPRAVADALAGVPYAAVEGFSLGASPYYLRRLGPADLMEPGFGYWVYATAPATWTVTP